MYQKELKLLLLDHMISNTSYDCCLELNKIILKNISYIPNIKAVIIEKSYLKNELDNNLLIIKYHNINKYNFIYHYIADDNDNDKDIEENFENKLLKNNCNNLEFIELLKQNKDKCLIVNNNINNINTETVNIIKKIESIFNEYYQIILSTKNNKDLLSEKLIKLKSKYN